MRLRCPICRSTKVYRIPHYNTKGKLSIAQRCGVCETYFSEQSITKWKGSKLPKEQREAMIKYLLKNPSVSTLQFSKVFSVAYKTAIKFRKKCAEEVGLPNGGHRGQAKGKVGYKADCQLTEGFGKGIS